MKYSISPISLGDDSCVSITESRFIEIANVNAAANALLHIEQAFHLVLHNYVALENELLSIAAHSLVCRSTLTSHVPRDALDAVRQIVNLLTTCRMYLDQTPHYFQEGFGSDSEHEMTFHKTRRALHSQLFGYQVMEELRNYVQHRGFPVQSMTTSKSWDDQMEYSQTTAIPCIRPSSLLHDEKFDQDVQQRMAEAAKKDKLDIRPLIREYIAALSEVQAAVRTSTNAFIGRCDDVLSDVIADATKEGFDFPDCVKLQQHDGPTAVEEHEVSMVPIKQLRELASSNHGNVALPRHFVSSSPK